MNGPTGPFTFICYPYHHDPKSLALRASKSICQALRACFLAFGLQPWARMALRRDTTVSGFATQMSEFSVYRAHKAYRTLGDKLMPNQALMTVEFSITANKWLNPVDCPTPAIYSAYLDHLKMHDPDRHALRAKKIKALIAANKRQGCEVVFTAPKWLLSHTEVFKAHFVRTTTGAKS